MPHVELPQAEFKVVLLGDTNTGKTSLVLRFVEGSYRSNRSSTVGAFFLTKRLTLDRSNYTNSMNLLTCKLLIWDTAGQPQFQRLALTYYKQAAAAIVCVDLSSHDVAQQTTRLQEWLEQVQQNVGPSHRIVLLVAGCKSDLLRVPPHTNNNNHKNNSNHHYSKISNEVEEQVKAIADKYQAIYVQTSAKDNVNVTEVFQRCAAAVLQCQQEAACGKGRPIPVTIGGSGGGGGGVGTKTMSMNGMSSSSMSTMSTTTPSPNKNMHVRNTATTAIYNNTSSSSNKNPNLLSSPFPPSSSPSSPFTASKGTSSFIGGVAGGGSNDNPQQQQQEHQQPQQQDILFLQKQQHHPSFSSEDRNPLASPTTAGIIQRLGDPADDRDVFLEQQQGSSSANHVNHADAAGGGGGGSSSSWSSSPRCVMCDNGSMLLCTSSSTEEGLTTPECCIL